MKKLRILQLPYPVTVIAVGTLISRFGTSMVLPYITILLVQIKHLPIFLTGITIGCSYLAQAFGASLTGKLFSQDKPLKLMKTSLVIYALIFISMGFISEWINNRWIVGGGFIICFLLAGMCRSLIEATGLTMISHLTPSQLKSFAFSLRYTFINIGTSLGPLTAILLGILHTNIEFYLASTAILTYYLLLQFTVKMKTFAFHTHANNLALTFKILISDRRLLYFTLAAILCYIGFSQQETLFAYIVYHYLASTHVFAVMYAINGITIVALQTSLVSYIEKFEIHYVLMMGILLLAIGLIGIAVSTIYVLAYYLSAFIFTLGEIFTLSLLSLYIDQLALPENRYAYFGISNFALLGRVTGPPLATLISHYVGLSHGLIVTACITLLGVPFIFLAKKKTDSHLAPMR